jgi:hypothetical protein
MDTKKAMEIIAEIASSRLPPRLPDTAPKSILRTGWLVY